MQNILVGLVAIFVIGFVGIKYSRYRITKAAEQKEYDRGLADGENDRFATSSTESYKDGYAKGLSPSSQYALAKNK